MESEFKNIESMSSGIQNYTKELHEKKMAVNSEVLTKNMDVQRLQMEVA